MTADDPDAPPPLPTDRELHPYRPTPEQIRRLVETLAEHMPHLPPDEEALIRRYQRGRTIRSRSTQPQTGEPCEHDAPPSSPSS
jgi:hypothetical protein